MRLIYFGSGTFGVPTLRALLEAGHDVACVVTQPDRGAGRGRKETPTPIRALAAANNLPVLPVENINDPAVVADLLARGASLGVVVAFGQKLGPDLLAGLPRGCINLHASLLPRFRGAAPIHHALLAGESETGVTVFRLSARMDAGTILTQARTEILPLETCGELHDRLATLGPRAVLDALRLFEAHDEPPGTPQDDALACRAPKLSKRDGVLDFSRPAREVALRIRAMSPWPGATAQFISAQTGRAELVTLLRATDADDPDSASDAVRGAAPSDVGPPGSLRPDLRIRCADGSVRVVEIKPAGGRAMTWPDFVNGRHVSSADRFAPPPVD